jgi:hypothetical protein
VIDLDEDDKITRLEDKWDGADQPQRFGIYVRICFSRSFPIPVTDLFVYQYLRRLHAKALPWVVRVPAKK